VAARRAGRRPRVVIVTPSRAAANNGNWHTAARWAGFLAATCDVVVASSWNGLPCDLLIALHAQRSAASIRSFAAAHPDRPLVVVLTGTDLYGDVLDSARSRETLKRATRLVVLNELAPRCLPSALRAKTVVILQSARQLSPGRKPRRHFAVAVLGHLRDVKNPQLVWALLRELPPDLPVRIRHIGTALDPALGRNAAHVAAQDRRYRWLGGLPRAQARQIVRNSHLLLLPSHVEGGAQSVIEAVTAHTAVIASDVDGNAGLLGRSYPGLFAADDAAAACALLRRAADEPGFLRQLEQNCATRATRFSPERERAALRRLVAGLLPAARPTPPSRPDRGQALAGAAPQRLSSASPRCAGSRRSRG